MRIFSCKFPGCCSTSKDLRPKSEGFYCFFIMEKEAALESPTSSRIFLQWGTRKRLRCVKAQVKQAEPDSEIKSTILLDRRVVRADKEAPAIILPTEEKHWHQIKSVLCTANKKVPPFNNSFLSWSPPPEKISILLHPVNNIMCTRSNSTENINNANTMQDSKISNSEVLVWPKFDLTLSRSEKEEDFLAIKGSKLPLRPRKRLKPIKRAIQNVSPGCWLSDICQDRYEVREEKCMKKRSRGLKAMRSVESDSE